MNLDWILTPLTVYGIVAVALMTCMILSLGTRLELCKVRKAAEESKKTLLAKLEETQKAMAQLSEQMAQTAQAAIPGGPIRHSINLTKRTQALRMRRRGESAESITAALSVPRNEVELLLKMQDLMDARKG